MDRETLLRNLAAYNFYQTIELGDGVKTPGLPLAEKQKQVLAFINSMNLEGKRAVDLGCANGLFAIAAEKRGAEEIIAVDHTKRNIESLETIIIPHLESKIKPKHLNVLDFTYDKYGTFDLVIFAGVLYHLKYPFLSLKVVRDLLKNGGTLILETGIFDDFNTRSFLFCPSPADTPQKTRGGNACSFFNEKALRETLRYFGIRVHSQVIITKPLRRFVKKLAGNIYPRYSPVSSIVLYCERDDSISDKSLLQFYESTTR